MDAHRKLELYGKVSEAYFATRDELDVEELYVDSMRLLATETKNEYGEKEKRTDLLAPHRLHRIFTSGFNGLRADGEQGDNHRCKT